MHCNQQPTPKFTNTKSFFPKKKSLKNYFVIALNINKPMTTAKFQI